MPGAGGRAVAAGSIAADVERVLLGFLAEERAALAGAHHGAVPLVDEVARLVGAGGKRVRPTLCVLGHLAGGGEVADPILRVAAALELFHTFALIHDDVMDGSLERRGVPTTHAVHGVGTAVLVGDFTQVLADHLLLSSRFPDERLVAALRRYTRMRVEAGVGQFLDLAAGGGSADESVAALKTASYTVEGPLHIGAILAGAGPDVLAALSSFGRPLGVAFQLLDDLRDAPRADGSRERAEALVAEALWALDVSPIPDAVKASLGDVAAAIGGAG